MFGTEFRFSISLQLNVHRLWQLISINQTRFHQREAMTHMVFHSVYNMSDRLCCLVEYYFNYFNFRFFVL